ncbi:MAG TPA: hypothetical protein VFB96_12735 [Pirellulaceae bacterium]|nr:hypothetical protein [Pirellulaceae bacterium]
MRRLIVHTDGQHSDYGSAFTSAVSSVTLFCLALVLKIALTQLRPGS